MIEVSRFVVFTLPKNFILIFIWVLFYGNIIFAQQSADLGTISPPKVNSIESLYVFDPVTELYIFSENIDGYPINTPLVLTVNEYEALVLKNQMQDYFLDKVQALSSYSSDFDEAQKNLLPEVYVNNKFFESIFGSNNIDITPQGSIGVDLGYRYQRSDNPVASVINRRSPGFDFDQRISLSLLGKIGERLQITANYDTESTFDFQNLVKIQFNPPKISDVSSIIPGKIGSSLNRLEESIDGVKEIIGGGKNTLKQAKEKIENLKNNLTQLSNSKAQVGNRVADYLKGKITEDAIIQNIDVGNISMPINSNLIQGAQNLFGVRADLKIGNTNISGVFSEQRSQSQNIVTQGGGRLQEFSFFSLDYEEDRHFFLSQYFRDNYNNFLANYPYINSPIQITRIEVWVTNRGYQTQNVRNILAIQDLGEANPQRTTLDDNYPQFFNT